ncbi:hypothetical protein [Dyella koreensis]|uniref:Copper-binding protein n=1 Tax=Dyella koreensis TaxID=311235 RepID=A0ABW8K4A0_9GAMM
MSTSSMRRLSLLAALGFALAVGSVAAQNAMPQDKMGSMHANVQGMHTMPATVMATDPKSGTVDVTAGGMALKVHFPPAAMAGLKVGDQITLHMGFSKP